MLDQIIYHCLQLGYVHLAITVQIRHDVDALAQNVMVPSDSDCAKASVFMALYQPNPAIKLLL
jgi:hypothetical protein